MSILTIEHERKIQPVISCAAYSPDGEWIAIAQATGGGNTLYLVDTRTFTNDSGGTFVAGMSEVRYAEFSADSKALVTVTHRSSVAIWETPSLGADETHRHMKMCGWPLIHLGSNDEESQQTFAKFGASNNILATAGLDRAYIWRLDKGVQSRLIISLGTLCTPYIAFNSKRNYLVVTSSIDFAAVWNSGDGQQIGPIIPHPPGFAIANFNPVRNHIVIGAANGSALIWSVDEERVISAWGPHDKPINIACFSPDGNVALTGSWDHTVSLWDYSRGTRRGKVMVSPDTIVEAAFSPDGNWVAASSGSWTTTAINTLSIWDSFTGNLLVQEQLASPITKMAFSPNGKRLLVILFDGSMKMYLFQP